MNILHLSQVDNKTSILSFPAYPAFHKTRPAEKSVGQSRLASFYVSSCRFYHIFHLSPKSQIIHFSWHITFAIQFTIVQRIISALIQYWIIEMPCLLFEIIQLSCHFPEVFLWLGTQYFKFRIQ